MTPDQLRELLEKAESPDRDKQGAAMSEVTFQFARKLLELWEAAERYREDVRSLDDWLRVNEALQALEEAK